MSKKALLERAKPYGVTKLLTVNSDPKTSKSSKYCYLTGILYMMPDDLLCPSSRAAGCRDACLVHAGRAAIFQSIPKARKAKTDFFHGDREGFLALLKYEIEALKKRANKNFMMPAVRLNGTSDIDWSQEKIHGLTLFELFRDIQFYDYTKRVNIIRHSKAFPNWHITASYSGSSEKYAHAITKAADYHNVNLAVVFDELPETWRNKKVINGDLHDLRFLDPFAIVGLKAKGGAKKDNSGFVQHVKNLIPAKEIVVYE